jgi:hypothetical protein
MKRKPMTHEEHLKFAVEVLEADRRLREILDRVQERYGRQHRIAVGVRRAIAKLDFARHDLYAEFRAVTSAEQLEQAGNAYLRPFDEPVHQELEKPVE